MTIPEFLALLPNSGWTLDEQKRIRRAGTKQCPIEFIANWKSSDYHAPHTKAGINIDDASLIMGAADDRDYSPEMREKLLKACGLEEAA